LPIFLTWNLKGALPAEVLDRFQRERERLEREPPRPGETNDARRLRHNKMVFAMADRYLDQADQGPLCLRDAHAAQIVEDSIVFGAGQRYQSFAYVVMPNHVHVLLTPHWRLEKITQGIKGYTAHEINALHDARGRAFWQDESYDHWARDEEEFYRIIAYIEDNPSKAGLCHRPGDWPWSSASKRGDWPAGQPFQADRR
jgi:hypothetical protein